MALLFAITNHWAKGLIILNKSDTALAEAAVSICEICNKAWQKNLMAGWSGNASLRLEAGILITAAGAAKGFLRPEDCLLATAAGKRLSGGRPSSESGVHLALYAKFPECKAILHTHPTALQALEAGSPETSNPCKALAALPLHEAAYWSAHFQYAPSFPPGRPEVARAVGAVAFNAPLPLGIWLARHGLVCMGETLLDCLCLTEELEHLAQVALAARSVSSHPGP